MRSTILGMTNDDQPTPEPWPETAVDSDAPPPQTAAAGPAERDGSYGRRVVK